MAETENTPLLISRASSSSSGLAERPDVSGLPVKDLGNGEYAMAATVAHLNQFIKHSLALSLIVNVVLIIANLNILWFTISFIDSSSYKWISIVLLSFMLFSQIICGVFQFNITRGQIELFDEYQSKLRQLSCIKYFFGLILILSAVVLIIR